MLVKDTVGADFFSFLNKYAFKKSTACEKLKKNRNSQLIKRFLLLLLFIFIIIFINSSLL